MRIELELTACYDDEETAELMLRSLDPDNEGHLTSERDGSMIRFRLSAESAGTLRNTADDLLACLKLAEQTLSLGTADAVPDLDGDPLLE